jgi:outer membrane lipoprotein SlyB
MFWDNADEAAALPDHKNEGVRRMAENNNRNRNGAAGRNKTNTAGVDTSEAVGTVGGGVAGAAAGSLLGPVGTIVGGVAGAVMGNKMGEGAEGTEGADKEAKNERK